MTRRVDSAAEIQRKYYSDTATRYDEMHAHEGAGDPVLIRFVEAILRMIKARSVLDVGTATGRGLRDLKQALPESLVCGIEPVRALIRQAAQNGVTAITPIVQGSGTALPFSDACFDVVCEFAVLHHVAEPNAVVREMLRVARKAVLICDSNRFGQGSLAARFIKLALYKSHLWGVYDFLRTAGKGYRITEGDSLSYSYSIYDSLELVRKWADRIILFSDVDKEHRTWLHPLLTSGGILVCALKNSD